MGVSTLLSLSSAFLTILKDNSFAALPSLDFFFFTVSAKPLLKLVPKSSLKFEPNFDQNFSKSLYSLLKYSRAYQFLLSNDLLPLSLANSKYTMSSPILLSNKDFDRISSIPVIKLLHSVTLESVISFTQALSNLMFSEIIFEYWK